MRTHNHCFRAKIKKNVYSCTSQFYYMQLRWWERQGLILAKTLGRYRVLDFSKEKQITKMSHRIRKQTMCICENKDADQLCSNCIVDHRLCFRYTDSTITLLKSQISRFKPAPVTIQASLWLSHVMAFPCEGSNVITILFMTIPVI